MRALLWSAVVGGLVAGCAKKLPGDYTGTLSESSTIITIKDGKMISSGGGAATTNVTMHVGQTGDNVTMVVKGCTISFVVSSRGSQAEAVSGQACPLSMDGYKGMTAVTGNLSREGRWLNAVVSLAATEAGTSGSHVVTFSGTTP